MFCFICFINNWIVANGEMDINLVHIPHIIHNATAIAGVAQGYKYLTLHPACEIHELDIEEYNWYTLARPQPQIKT